MQINNKKSFYLSLLMFIIIVSCVFIYFSKDLFFGSKIDKGDEAVYFRMVDEKKHLVVDGKDYGEVEMNGTFRFSQGNFVFEKEINGEKHVIYNGKDVGIGFDPELSGRHLVFYRNVGSDKHLIYDGKDLGAIGDYRRKIGFFGDSLAFEKKEIDGLHVVFNGEDMGLGYDVVLSEDGKNVAFTRIMDDGRKVIVHNGNIFELNNSGGDVDRIYAVDGEYVYYGLDEDYTEQGDLLINFFRNDEALGSGFDFSYSVGNYAYEKKIGDEWHIIHNGNDLGSFLQGLDFWIAGKNIVFFKMDDAGEPIMIYNGENIGQGSSPVISVDGDLVYVKYVDGGSHVIYNGNDLGTGSNPMLSPNGKKVTFIRRLGDGPHLFSGDGKDMGKVDPEQGLNVVVSD